ncbi:MAG: hypothetical protein ACI8RZ_000101 [Myxococcota bacterium]|jgi:hypothetical protein
MILSLLSALVLGCTGSTPSPAPEVAAPPVTPTPPETPPPALEARCGETPPANDAPWTAATPADFLPGFTDYPSCPVVLGDFNADGAQDVAVLEANTIERRARLRFVMADGTSIVAVTWPTVPAEMGSGVVPTLVNPKPVSKDVARDNMSDDARKALAGRDAVETCHAEGEALETADISDLCYCSSFWVIDDGVAKGHLVCD